jgi:rhodanese-related sulfurtransferase
MSFTEITVTELAAKLVDIDHQYQFVDVREPQELAVVTPKIHQSTLERTR